MFQKRSPLVNVEILGLFRNILLLHRLGWLVDFFLTFSKFSFPILNNIRKCLSLNNCCLED